MNATSQVVSYRKEGISGIHPLSNESETNGGRPSAKKAAAKKKGSKL